MVALCGKCGRTFDSHDGGLICCVCGIVLCDVCEHEHGDFDNSICNKCKAEGKGPVAEPQIPMPQSDGAKDAPVWHDGGDSAQ
jgi:hypothetical protein